MYYTYILFSKEDNKFYIGYTSDLKRRLAEHENNKVYSTSRFAAPKLIFYEAFFAQDDAKRRERYFKTTKGKKALKLILRDSLVRFCPVV